ncbi:enterobactin exporter EntS [Falsiruegeria litorea R37]|uniref:Enterobactin exporter EntS n=1 Tax=Falsiruegeria litorea R37 TaxID=1200284 RepID=A0A1Y5RZB8_9RHOB|nr:MFS transporter [Falsiruegeria litorea]SLN29155.1 enterobactin exporter EntS [Falsiruegeria litorea R37]
MKTPFEGAGLHFVTRLDVLRDLTANAGMTTLWSLRNYRLLFSASAISNLGDGVSALAFPWLATLITRDPMLIAMVAFATRLPWLLFSIPAGVWTDRMDRRRLMVQADLVRMLLTFGVVAVILSAPEFPVARAELYIAAISVLAFLLGSAEVLRDNAAQTALPAVVSADQLEQANGQLWSIEQIMGSFVGPPLAGLLIATAVPAPFVLDAASFALAAGLVWCMAIAPRLNSKRRSWLIEAREGITWLRWHRIILQLAIMLGLMNTVSLMTLTVLILYSQEILGLGAAGHGLLLTAGAAGGVAGGLLCPNIAARLGRRASLLIALALLGAALAVIWIATSVWLVAVALFIEMFAALLWNVVTVSYRQRLIPDELLGRVNSLYRFFGWGMMPFGALIGGAIVSLVEPTVGRESALRLPYLLGAGGMGAIWLYAWQQLRL